MNRKPGLFVNSFLMTHTESGDLALRSDAKDGIMISKVTAYGNQHFLLFFHPVSNGRVLQGH